MHMADALLSPPTGGVMWLTTAVTMVYSARKVQNRLDEKKIPLMGVLGAFVFAAQMINFTIPGTGSSGHLGGGLLLAVLLGPHAAFLTIASVLTVQALFFADGGLLALGCNIFNLGFFPCFVAYPLVYKPMAGPPLTRLKLIAASVSAAVVGLQFGAMGVVFQTVLSGISVLPLASFFILMQPIHLAIGLVEGLVTAGIVSFIWQARPELLERTRYAQPLGDLPLKNILIVLFAATIFTGGVLAWFASGHPDGLEWAIEKVTGTPEIEAPQTSLHSDLESIQQKTGIMPDYAFKEKTDNESSTAAVRTGTSVAGIAGGLVVMLLAFLIGYIFKKGSGPTA